MPLATAHPGWACLLIVVLVALDAVLPIIPGETAVLAGAAMAARGDLEPAGVLAAAAAGAFLGDLGTYAVGRGLGHHPTLGRLACRPTARRAAAWLCGGGAPVLVTARFVPGGRTASTLSAGMLRVPLRRFTTCVALGAVLWSVYLTGVGYAGGRLFNVPPMLLAPFMTLLAAGAGLLAARLRPKSADTPPGNVAPPRATAAEHSPATPLRLTPARDAAPPDSTAA